jgi:mannose PTS system EIIA component
MVGVVLVTREPVAFTLIEAARRVVGAIPNLVAVCVSVGEDSASMMHRVEQASRQVEDGAGFLLMVELYGSTPFNVSLAIMSRSRASDVVCGLNLPRLLKLATLDRCKLTPAGLACELQNV